MNLLENAPFNIGKAKQYEGVAGNLVAFTCKVSFQAGFEGFLAFTAKTKLMKHYEENLGAIHFGRRRMLIQTHSAKLLVEKYFKEKFMGYIKDTKGIDFIIKSNPLTNKDRDEISELIAEYKKKTKKLKEKKRITTTRKSDSA